MDPYVSGVLPITVGKAVRLTDIVLSSDKEYVCLMRLHADRPEARIREVVSRFQGKIYQTSDGLITSPELEASLID